MSVNAMAHRFTEPPPRNVGGGDLLTRALALVLLAVLAGMVAPQAKVPFPLLKISLLIATELGLISVMLGLFLRSKTYFAGILLFTGAMAMLLLVGQKWLWAGVAVGLVFVAAGIPSVVTRRSRLNALLQISSLRVPLEEAEDAAAADPVPSPLNPLTPGVR